MEKEKEFWRDDRAGSRPFRRELTWGWLCTEEAGENEGPEVELCGGVLYILSRLVDVWLVVECWWLKGGP